MMAMRAQGESFPGLQPAVGEVNRPAVVVLENDLHLHARDGWALIVGWMIEPV
jgi:hypothetical protein